MFFFFGNAIFGSLVPIHCGLFIDKSYAEMTVTTDGYETNIWYISIFGGHRENTPGGLNSQTCHFDIYDPCRRAWY